MKTALYSGTCAPCKGSVFKEYQRTEGERGLLLGRYMGTTLGLHSYAGMLYKVY